MSQETPKNVQHNNAQNSVLFEAMNLAIHLDPESKVVSNASILLGRFILARETNVRYLGLDAMAHLAACSISLEPVKRHQDTIILSLKDRDISVRRRALDLLYSMCDTTNSKKIVGELLRYLQVADYNLREEMVLKIAILTERFATEVCCSVGGYVTDIQYEWYIDTILQLISTAGDHVGAEVWYRVVQVVTNNENLQAYASAAVYRHLQAAQCHESMVKVGGEFWFRAHALTRRIHSRRVWAPYRQRRGMQPDRAVPCSSLEDQHLHRADSCPVADNICQGEICAMYEANTSQWVNLFPEIKDHLVNIFRRYTHVLDAELQQRACEYLALATMGDNDELLQAVCDEMPIFPERESALINRLHQRGEQAQDKRTWVIGQQAENKDRVAERFKSFRKTTVGSTMSNNSNDTPVPPPKSASLALPSASERARSGSLIDEQPPALMPQTTSQMSSDIMSSLAGLDLSTPIAVPEQRLLPDTTLMAEPDTMSAVPTPVAARPDDFQHNATMGGVNPSLLAPVTIAPNIEKWLERLTYATEGVLYEDKQVQIGINAEYHGSKGRIALFIGNKLPTSLTSISSRIELPGTLGDALDAKFHEDVVPTIAPGQQIQEMIHVECKSVFTEQPILRLTYLAGAFTTLVLRLPIFLNRFIEGVQLDQASFFDRWKIIGGKSQLQNPCSSKLTLTSRRPPRSAADLLHQAHPHKRGRHGPQRKGPRGPAHDAPAQPRPQPHKQRHGGRPAHVRRR
jgi:AP-2 complex subunit alpha